jgi:DNA-binding Lrp family transcriptional regulator
LQNIPSVKKKELIDEFIDYKNIWVVYSTVGQFDIGSVIFVDNVYEFYKFYNKIADNYGKYIDEKITAIYIKADEYEKSYLLPEKSKNKRIHYLIVDDEVHYTIDELDYKILNEIVSNARIPQIELAKKLKTSSQTIIARIKKLTTKGIIKNFRVDVDLSKLGLNYFYIQFKMRDNSRRKDIVNYLKDLPSFKCLNIAIGYTDMDLEFICGSVEEMDKLLDELDEKFPNSIRNYFYFKNRQTYKERWLPEMEFK